MKCNGDFIFKEIRKIDGGTFKNSAGVDISYSEKYRIKVDEFTEDGINERTFNLDIDSKLVNEFKKLQAYDKVFIEFDLRLYANSCRLIPVAIKV